MEALTLAEQACEEKLRSLTQAKVRAPAHPESFSQAKARIVVPLWFSKHHETQMDRIPLASECLLYPTQHLPSSCVSFSFSSSFLPFHSSLDCLFSVERSAD